MSEYHSHPLLITETMSIWDVVCPGKVRHESDEERTPETHVVFPYRGLFVKHVGDAKIVADPNQVLFFNEDEPYRVSHPLEGGDRCISIGVGTEALQQLASPDFLQVNGHVSFNLPRMRIDARTQAMLARLRYSLDRGLLETLEAETLALALLERALRGRSSHAAVSSPGRQKTVDRAKLVLASDLGRRWTLAQIAATVGVSPVYLTQMFQQVEGLPLYRYQLQLRLARALDLLGNDSDLTGVALDLGFSSYSHFSCAFKKAYGLTPFEFRRSTNEGDRTPPT
jgi:AraC family transcriptional regulator